MFPSPLHQWVMLMVQLAEPLLEIQSLSLFVVYMVLLLLVMITIFYSRAHHNQKRNLNLPPSPPNKLPIIGHLHQLGASAHKNLMILARNHGPDLMLLNLGHAPTVVVSSAKAAREIMKTHDLVFSSRPPLQFAKRIFYDKDVGFTPYGDYWRQVRKICILHLLSAKRVQSYRTVREEETSIMIDKISSIASTSGVVNLTEILMSFTSDLVCKVALGKKYSGEEVGGKFGEIMVNLIHLLGVFNVADYIPWLSWVNNFNGLNKKVKNVFKELDDFLEGVIEEHIHHNKKVLDGGGTHDGNIDEEDVVGVLLGIANDGSSGISLGRDSIKAITLDMFSAGTDTSHATLDWAMAELIKHPQILKDVQEEVREIGKGKPNITEDDLDKMHYLKLVIKETLRFHPPATLLIPRESTEDIILYGYDILAKTRLIINAWAIGRDPNSWTEPEKFEPKRFMNSSIDYKGQHFEFIPFGAGRRGCPGTLFATSAIELCLANVLYRYDWKLPNGAGEDELDMAESGPGIIIHRKSPLLLVPTDYLHA